MFNVLALGEQSTVCTPYQRVIWDVGGTHDKINQANGLISQVCRAP